MEVTPLVIVISPRRTPVAVNAVGTSCDTVHFSSFEELDDWRRAGAPKPTSIWAYVHSALLEAGILVFRCSPPMHRLLQALGDFPSTPIVKEIESMWSSRRGFYRAWNKEMPGLTPAQFLRRVRLLHAADLIDRGRTPRDAAREAGLASHQPLLAATGTKS